MRRLMPAAAVAALIPMTALAQTSTEALDDAEIVTLQDWDYAPLYAEGWSADRLMDEVEVVDATGEEIGDVENLLIGPDGRIVSVIVEVGGFWDIGDTHVSVPWDEVTLAQDTLAVPLTEETIEDYGLFEQEVLAAGEAGEQIVEVDDDLTATRAWRASELIGDYARLEDMSGYGYVTDLLFDQQGQLQAVVVDPDVAYGVTGPYAYPYYGYGMGFAPGRDYYGLPYARDDVADMETFDYDDL